MPAVVLGAALLPEEPAEAVVVAIPVMAQEVLAVLATQAAAAEAVVEPTMALALPHLLEAMATNTAAVVAAVSQQA